MIVAIDARHARQPLSGIGRYTINLTRGLQLAEDADVKKIVLLVSPSCSFFAQQRDDPRFVFESLAAGDSVLKSGEAVRRILSQRQVDILHTPDAFGLLTSSCRRVVTIHDLIPFRCRKLLHRSTKSRAWPLWLAWLRLQVMRADHIITVSEFSRQDIIRILRARADRVSVVHNGVPKPDNTEGGTRPYRESLPGRILYVGRRDPYKNIDGLVRAFAQVVGRVPFATLMVVGDRDPRYREAEQLAARMGLGNAVQFEGRVDDAALDMAYRRAAVFAFPSFYEGFGLPPLEAMARGVPVVASNRSSLPEVLGNAAVLVNPANIGEMAEAIANVLTNAKFAEELSCRGFEHVKKFSLTAQAGGTVNVYRQILGGKQLRAE